MFMKKFAFLLVVGLPGTTYDSAALFWPPIWTRNHMEIPHGRNWLQKCLSVLSHYKEGKSDQYHISDGSIEGMIIQLAEYSLLLCVHRAQRVTSSLQQD